MAGRCYEIGEDVGGGSEMNARKESFDEEREEREEARLETRMLCIAVQSH